MMDRGASMHTVHRDLSSSSAGKMQPPLLLMLLGAPPVAAVAGMAGTVAARHWGSWVVDTVALADVWNGRYGFLAALNVGKLGLTCCEGPAC